MINIISIIKSDKTIRNIALILLGVFVFSFLHSELGFLDYDGNDTACKVYCEIVKNTNSHLKTLKDNLPKLEVKKDLCVHCFEEIETQTVQTCFERTDHHLIVKQSTEIYLFNRSFLI